MMGGNKKIVCEFCQKTSRRDHIAYHVQSRCKNNLLRHLLKKWDRVQPIQAFLDTILDREVQSQEDKDYYYIFGEHPKFVPKDKMVGYMTDDKRYESHRMYLTSLFGTLPLSEVMLPTRTEPTSLVRPDHTENTGHTEVASPSHTHIEVSSSPSPSS